MTGIHQGPMLGISAGGVLSIVYSAGIESPPASPVGSKSLKLSAAIKLSPVMMPSRG